MSISTRSNKRQAIPESPLRIVTSRLSPGRDSSVAGPPASRASRFESIGSPGTHRNPPNTSNPPSSPLDSIPSPIGLPPAVRDPVEVSQIPPSSAQSPGSAPGGRAPDTPPAGEVLLSSSSASQNIVSAPLSSVSAPLSNVPAQGSGSARPRADIASGRPPARRSPVRRSSSRANSIDVDARARSGRNAAFNAAVYGAGHPWVPVGLADHAASPGPSPPISGFAVSAGGARPTDRPDFSQYSGYRAPTEVPYFTAPPVPPAPSLTLAPSAPFVPVPPPADLEGVRARFERGEHLGSLASLRNFVRSFGASFTAAEARSVANLVADRQALEAFAGGEAPRVASPVPVPASAGVTEGKFSSASSSPFFTDLDGFAHTCDALSPAALQATSTAYNSDMLRWRFLGNGAAEARAILCPPLNPFAFDAESFREWVTREASSYTADTRHPFLQGPWGDALWPSLVFLVDLHWTSSSRLFSGLASVNLGSFPRVGKSRVTPGQFLPDWWSWWGPRSRS
jgi:hypothetical protein